MVIFVIVTVNLNHIGVVGVSPLWPMQYLTTPSAEQAQNHSKCWSPRQREIRQSRHLVSENTKRSDYGVYVRQSISYKEKRTLQATFRQTKAGCSAAGYGAV